MSLTYEKVEEFVTNVKQQNLFGLANASYRVEWMSKDRMDAVIVIGDKMFAITENSEGTLLVGGYGAVEEAVYIRHGVWKLTQNGKTYSQNILEEWATVAQ